MNYFNAKHDICFGIMPGWRRKLGLSGTKLGLVASTDQVMHIYYI